MSTVDKVGNRRDYVNLFQLYGVIRRKEHRKFLQFIIERQRDVNYKIPVTDFLQIHRPELIGSTALHLALDQDNFECFNILLQYKADYNIKNNKQVTVVSRAVEENFIKQKIAKLENRFKYHDKDFTIGEVNSFVAAKDKNERENFCKYENWRLWSKFEDKYVNSILSTSLITKNVPKYSHDDKISLLHAACLANNIEAVEFFLKNGADANAPSSSPIFNGFTSLHFAVKYSCVEIVKILLANRANLSTWDSKFMLPVDLLVDQNMKITEWLHAKNKLPYRSSILDYVENEEKLISMIRKNDEIHFSGFHVACTVTNVSSVHVNCLCRGSLPLDKFLEGNLWQMYDRFLSNSTVFSGYTALHFAAFSNIDTAKLLIKNRTDIEAVNDYETTPLDALESRATIDDLYFILSHKETWKNIKLADGKTKLVDLVASMSELSILNTFLRDIDDINLRIPKESPLWPGYTTLHLVVTFQETVEKTRFLKNIFNRDRSNLKVEYEKCCEEQQKTYRDRIVLCLIKNADVTVQDARGRTAINLAFRRRNLETVKSMLKNHDKAVNPTDEDNLSHLHIACLTKRLDLVEKLLMNGAVVNAAVKSSFKWHCDYHRCTSTDVFDVIGSTPLHLSVCTSNLDLVKLLLKYGADVNAKDGLGLTPLHRIFVMQQLWEIDKNLFSDCRTLKHDCECGLDKLVHMPKLSKLPKDERISNELLSSPNLRESVVDGFGLSHVHVAVYHGNADVARRLLDEGSNVNLIITFPKDLESNHPLFVLRRYDGYAPLHMIRDKYLPQLEKSLLKRGADFLMRRGDGMNELFVKLQDSYRQNSALYVRTLRDNETLRERLKEEFGWTILHVACQLVDFNLASFAISSGVHVNFRTKEDSPMHPGCTALRVLMVNSSKSGEAVESILTLLLENGADVMVADGRGNTPMHRCDFVDRNVRRLYTNSIYTDRLLQHVKDFNVNPTNYEGISVFHVACMRHDVDVISNFLDHGVDVNRPVEFFSDNDLAGCTPLHLAVSCRPPAKEKVCLNIFFSSAVEQSGDTERQLLTIELLLKRGADVNAENAVGNTPLHIIAEGDQPRDALFEMMFSHGADVTIKNVYGKTPFESLLRSTGIISQDLELFLKLGCRMNTFNEVTQVGYIPLFLESIVRSKEVHTLKKLVWSCPSINEVDCKGRTAVHNFVSSMDFPYTLDHSVVEYLMERGCDIDRQDTSGMTALHLAARFRNSQGVEALLSYGCDVNVIDSTGRTAFAYALGTEFLSDLTESEKQNHQLVVPIFMRIFYHMTRRGLYVNNVNRETLARACRKYDVDRFNIQEDYEKIKGIKIGDTTFNLEDFLSETKAIVRYSKIPREDREVIERFFAKPVADVRRFHLWTFLCKLQYRKALQRAELVESAREAMNIVAGFSVPDLCYEVIENFLSNADLKSLIVAASL